MGDRSLFDLDTPASALSRPEASKPAAFGYDLDTGLQTERKVAFGWEDKYGREFQDLIRKYKELGIPEDQAAKRIGTTYTLARELDMSPSFVAENIDSIIETYSGMKQEPDSWWNEWKKALQAGMLTVEMIRTAGPEVLYGNGLSPEKREAIRQIQAKMPQYSETIKGLPGEAIKSFLEMLPLQVQNMYQGLEYGSKGALTAVAASLIAGLPETAALGAATVGFGAGASIAKNAAAGFMVAQRAGMLKAAGESEGILHYIEALDACDEYGMDPKWAQQTAIPVAVVNGLLEMAQLDALFASIPGLRNIVGDSIATTATRSLFSGWASEGIKKAAKFGMNYGSEVLTEYLQERMTSYSQEFMKELSNRFDGTNIPKATQAEIKERLLETVKSAALGFLPTMLPGAVVDALPAPLAQRMKANTRAAADMRQVGVTDIASLSEKLEQNRPAVNSTLQELARNTQGTFIPQPAASAEYLAQAVAAQGDDAGAVTDAQRGVIYYTDQKAWKQAVRRVRATSLHTDPQVLVSRSTLGARMTVNLDGTNLVQLDMVYRKADTENQAKPATQAETEAQASPEAVESGRVKIEERLAELETKAAEAEQAMTEASSPEEIGKLLDVLDELEAAKEARLKARSAETPPEAGKPTEGASTSIQGQSGAEVQTPAPGSTEVVDTPMADAVFSPEIREGLQRAMPAMTPQELEAAAVLVDLRAEAMGMPAQAWVDQYLAPGVLAGPEVAAEMFARAPAGADTVVAFADDGKAVIAASKATTFEGFVHELAHVFRRQMTDQELATAAAWAGIADWAQGSAEQIIAAEEKFAEGFVQWLREGKAPTPELETVFQRFAEWLRTVWNAMRDKWQLSPDIESVYNALLTPAAEAEEDAAAPPEAAPQAPDAGEVVAEVPGVGAKLVPPGPEVLASIHNWEQWKSNVRELAAKRGIDAKTVDRFLEGIEAKTTMLRMLGDQFSDRFPTTTTELKKGKPRSLGSGPVRDNVDPLYIHSIDFLSQCVRRMGYAMDTDEIIRRTGKMPDIPMDMAFKMYRYFKGVILPCLYCYVEHNRAKAAEYFERGLDQLYDKKYRPPEDKERTKRYFEAARKEKMPRDEKLIDREYFLNTEHALEADKDPAHPSKQYPATYKWLDYVMKAAKANILKAYEEYAGQIMLMPRTIAEAGDGKASVEYLNQRAGLRLFSTSDFQIEHVFDMIQVLTDMSIVGLQGHLYTRVPFTIQFLKNSGIKQNMSLMFLIDDQGKMVFDADGRPVMDDRQSFPSWDMAVRFRAESPDVGTMLMVTSDEQIWWGLDNDQIDYMIPFHYSGMEKDYWGPAGLKWTDYTQTQHEKWLSWKTEAEVPARFRKMVSPVLSEKGNVTGYEIDPAKLPESLREFVDEKGRPSIRSFQYLDQKKGTTNAEAKRRYLALCEKIGCTPVFPQFVEHPNYIKLKKDYSRTDTPFRAATPDVDLEFAHDVMKDWVKTDQELEANEELVEEFLSIVKDQPNEWQAVMEWGKKRQAERVARARAMSDKKLLADARALSDTDLLAHSPEQLVQDPDFMEWFGDSKVVDDLGLPLRVYHGTPAGRFESFDHAKGRETPFTFHFTDDPKYASGWATEFMGEAALEQKKMRPTVYPVYLSIEHPLVTDDSSWQNPEKEDIDRLRRDGHDGVIMQDGDRTEYVVLDPGQIKSVFNRGAWNPFDNRILAHSPEQAMQSPEFRKWFKDSRVADSAGLPLVVYHGTTADFKAFGRTADFGYHAGTAAQANTRVLRARYAVDRGDGGALRIRDTFTGDLREPNGITDAEVEMETADLNAKPQPARDSRILPLYMSIQNPIRMPDIFGIGTSPRSMAQTLIAAVKKVAAQGRVPADKLEKAVKLLGGAGSLPTERAFYPYAVKALKMAGIDGIVYTNQFEGKGDSWVAFDASQLKSVYNRGTWDATLPEVLAHIPDPEEVARAREALERGEWVKPELLKDIQEDWAQEELEHHAMLLEDIGPETDMDEWLEHVTVMTPEEELRSPYYYQEFWRWAKAQGEDRRTVELRWLGAMEREPLENVLRAVASSREELPTEWHTSVTTAIAKVARGEHLTEGHYQSIMDQLKAYPLYYREQFAKWLGDDEQVRMVEREREEASKDARIEDLRQGLNIALKKMENRDRTINDLEHSLKMERDWSHRLEERTKRAEAETADFAREVKGRVEDKGKEARAALGAEREQARQDLRNALAEVTLRERELAETVAQAERAVADAERQGQADVLEARRQEREQARAELAQVREQYKARMQEYKDYKQGVQDRALDRLRTTHRENLDRVKKHAAEVQKRARERKQLLEYAKRMMRSIMRPVSGACDVDFAVQIQEIQAGLDMKKNPRRDAARQRLREYYAAHPGETPTPTHAAEMARRSLYTLSIRELEELNERVTALRRLGKRQREVAIWNEKEELAAWKAKVLQTLRVGLVYPVGSEQADAKRHGRVDYNVAANTWGMQRLARLMDGGKEGVFYELLWTKINEMDDAKLRQIRERKEAGHIAMKELGLQPGELGELIEVDGVQYTRDEVISMYIYQQDEDSYLAMVHGNGISHEAQEQYISQLTDEERQWGDYLMSTFGIENFRRIQGVLSRDQNRLMERVLKYFPMRRLDVTGQEHYQDVGRELAGRTPFRRAYPGKKFTISRIHRIKPEHQIPIRLGATAIWEDQINRQENYIAMAEGMKLLHGLFTHDKDIRTAIQNKFGQAMLNQTEKYLNDVANPRIFDAMEGYAMVSRKLRAQYSTAYLAFNLLTPLKQLPALTLFMGRAGAGEMIAASARMMKNPMEAIRFAEERDEQFRQRTIDRYQEDLRALDSNLYERIIQKVGKVGFAPLQALDKAVAGIGWIACYESYKKAHPDAGEAEAIHYAQDQVLATQQAGRAKDLPGMYRSGEAANWLLMFTNQLNKQWQMITADIPMDFRSDRKAQAVWAIAGLVVGALATGLVSRRRFWREPREAAIDLATNIFSAVPFFGNALAGGLEGYYSGGVTPFPVAAAVGAALREWTDGDEGNYQDLKAVLTLLEEGAAFAGIPVVQGKRIVKTITTGDPWQIIGGRRK